MAADWLRYGTGSRASIQKKQTIDGGKCREVFMAVGLGGRKSILDDYRLSITFEQVDQ